MKKFTAFTLSLVMAFSLAACGSSSTSNDKAASSDQTDMEYVKEKGTLVVGMDWI